MSQDPDHAAIAANFQNILKLVGEDPSREGLLKTPMRVAKSLDFLTSGYRKSPDEILKQAIFHEQTDEMVVVRDVELYSMCLPSNQLVNAVSGAKRAGRVEVGDSLWTLVDGRVEQTVVVGVSKRPARELVEVETDGGSFRATPDHPVATSEGWVEAKDLGGRVIEWTNPKQLCRDRYKVRAHDWSFGYAVGAMASDGTVGKRCISLVVNEENFARRGTGDMIVSGNIPFLEEVAEVIDARFTPRPDLPTSALYVSDRWDESGWHGKHGFRQEDHRTDLIESSFVRVKNVTRVAADGKKPFSVYSYTCDPHPTFLVAGHLTHNCEHHMLPFFGKAHVAYIPDGKIVGLSKIPRIVDAFARRLQVQERLTVQIASALNDALTPRGAAVVIEAKHLCMMMRGVEKQNSFATTSCMLGEFKHDPKTRAEFLNLIGRRGV